MGVRDFLAAVWPVSTPADSETQRRKKQAVRSGQLAMVVMVTAAVAGAIVADFQRYSAPQVVGLITAALIYIGWSLHGTRNAVRLLLWEGGDPPGTAGLRDRRGRAVGYFSVQLGLAGLLYFLGDQGQATPLVWLVLLPPVAHSVILLSRPGIVVVSCVSIVILLWSVVRWHGWGLVPVAFLEFLFAVLFTIVFTLLAVSSERSRSDVQRLASELGEANLKLREYAVQAEELAATRERNRLAREIHDSLGHYLTVVHVQLEAARALSDRDPGRARDALAKAQSLTQEGLQEIRRSVSALRASPLDHQSLVEALRQLADESTAAGLAAEVEVLGAPRSLSPQAELALYRAGQEGLTNARKHAQARHARLSLDYGPVPGVRLTVSDDGVGASPAATAAGGFGLLGLRERVQLLGGTMTTRTAPGNGFTLEVEVPG